MCANCVSKADVVVGSVAFAAYVFKGPIQDGLVAAGLLPEPHPLAADIRAVHFLRSVDLEPVVVLGAEKVEAVERVLAFGEPKKIYRRSFRDVLALCFPGSMRSQRVFATK